MTIDMNTLEAVAACINAGGWPCSVEYPAFIQHAQQDAGSTLEINIGPDPSSPDRQWSADYVRDGRYVGGWHFHATPADSPETIAAHVLHHLQTATVEA